MTLMNSYVKCACAPPIRIAVHGTEPYDITRHLLHKVSRIFLNTVLKLQCSSLGKLFRGRQLADLQNSFSLSSLETESVFTQSLHCPEYKLSPSFLCIFVQPYDFLVNELLKQQCHVGSLSLLK